MICSECQTYPLCAFPLTPDPQINSLGGESDNSDSFLMDATQQDHLNQLCRKCQEAWLNNKPKALPVERNQDMAQNQPDASDDDLGWLMEDLGNSSSLSSSSSPPPSKRAKLDQSAKQSSTSSDGTRNRTHPSRTLKGNKSTDTTEEGSPLGEQTPPKDSQNQFVNAMKLILNNEERPSDNTINELNKEAKGQPRGWYVDVLNILNGNFHVNHYPNSETVASINLFIQLLHKNDVNITDYNTDQERNKTLYLLDHLHKKLSTVLKSYDNISSEAKYKQDLKNIRTTTQKIETIKATLKSKIKYLTIPDLVSKQLQLMRNRDKLPSYKKVCDTYSCHPSALETTGYSLIHPENTTTLPSLHLLNLKKTGVLFFAAQMDSSKNTALLDKFLDELIDKEVEIRTLLRTNLRKAKIPLYVRSQDWDNREKIKALLLKNGQSAN
jgi:hypothetical protein